MALKDLFKPKEGGTKVGNFLRKVTQTAATVVGGVGAGAAVKKIQDVRTHARDEKLSKNENKQVEEAVNKMVQGNTKSITGIIEQSSSGTGQPTLGTVRDVKSGKKFDIVFWFKSQSLIVKIAMFALPVGIILFLILKNKKRKGRR